MYRLQDQTIENAEIVLTNEHVNCLGPNLLLKDCRLILKTSARGLILAQPQLIGCRIEAKKRFVNCQEWPHSHLINCTFVGKFHGNDFGNWPGDEFPGSLQDCDFSEAILDGCRFLDCDVESITFPKWPCFTILFPRTRMDEILALNWPGDHLRWASDLGRPPEFTVAVSDYAPEKVKHYGGTEEELRQTLERLGGVII